MPSSSTAATTTPRMTGTSSSRFGPTALWPDGLITRVPMIRSCDARRSQLVIATSIPTNKNSKLAADRSVRSTARRNEIASPVFASMTMISFDRLSIDAPCEIDRLDQRTHSAEREQSAMRQRRRT